MNVRIKASEVQVGDTLVSVGKRVVNRKVLELREKPVGSIVVGPRGGRYRLNVPQLAIMTGGPCPVVNAHNTVVVYREEAQA